MNKISVFLCSLTLLAGTVEADVNVGGNAIWRGTTIEVAGPHPDLDIQAIIDGITDASASKLYLIELGAGLYDIGDKQIVMKTHVSIRGAGVGVTVIESRVSSGDPATSAVIVGATGANMTEFEVRNSGGSGHSIAIYNSGASPVIDRVSAIALAGAMSMNTVGVWNDASNPTMNQTSALATGGAGHNDGVLNVNTSAPIMFQVVATGQGGSSSVGVGNEGSSPRMNEVTAKALGRQSYGVASILSSAPVIQNSYLSGATAGLAINADSPSTRVANSMIVGGVLNVVRPPGNKVMCRGNYDADLQDVSCSTTH